MITHTLYKWKEVDDGYQEWSDTTIISTIESYHRLGGPSKLLTARIWYDGSEEWWVNGELHRINGPAVITNDKSPMNEWWIHNNQITNEVDEWMEKNNILWPWNEDIQVLFQLTFVI